MTTTEGGDAADGRSCRADFTFLQELGRGTWGTVHVARRLQDGQLYAIKAVELVTMGRKDQLDAVSEAQVGQEGLVSVPPHRRHRLWPLVSRPASCRQRIGSSASCQLLSLTHRSTPLQMLASLDSPHIVRYYDSYLHQGQLHIVQEYCAGGSLHAAIRAAPRPLTEDVIWRVLLHTALALHHMHGRWGSGSGSRLAGRSRRQWGAGWVPSSQPHSPFFGTAKRPYPQLRAASVTEVSLTQPLGQPPFPPASEATVPPRLPPSPPPPNTHTQAHAPP